MALPNLPLGEDQISFALQKEEKDGPSSGSAVSSLPMGGNQPPDQTPQKGCTEEREEVEHARCFLLASCWFRFTWLSEPDVS